MIVSALMLLVVAEPVRPTLCDASLRWPGPDLILNRDATVVLEWMPPGCEDSLGANVVVGDGEVIPPEDVFAEVRLGDLSFFTPQYDLEPGDVARVSGPPSLGGLFMVTVGTSSLAALTLPPAVSVTDARWSSPDRFGLRNVVVELSAELLEPDRTSLVTARLTPPGPEVKNEDFFALSVVDESRSRRALTFESALLVGPAGICFVVNGRDLSNSLGPGAQVCAIDFVDDPSLPSPPDGCAAVSAADPALWVLFGLLLFGLLRRRLPT